MKSKGLAAKRERDDMFAFADVLTVVFTECGFPNAQAKVREAAERIDVFTPPAEPKEEGK